MVLNLFVHIKQKSYTRTGWKEVDDPGGVKSTAEAANKVRSW